MSTSHRYPPMARQYNCLYGAVAVLLIACNAQAAETATLSGIVRDPSDAAIAGAKIALREEATGTERHTQTNNTGLFSAPGLHPGLYSIKIEAEGFKTINSSGVPLGVAETKQIDFTLELGNVEQAVSVDGHQLLTDAEDASVGMRLDRQFVENLPLNGRSFQQLITTAPGVTLTGDYHDYGEFSISGQRATSNYFTVDGVDANLGLGFTYLPGAGEALSASGGTNALLSVDALQEFRILTNSFAPEYGRTPGGHIIMLTRAGTNTFHGSVFEYFRNNALDANDWFANSHGSERSPLRFNDFGATLGGPVLKNRTFFFFSYEGQRLRQPQFSITAVPDAAARHAASSGTAALLNAFPVPNGPELGNSQAQFSAGYSNPTATDATSLRVDQQLGSRATAFARYSYAPSYSLLRGGSLALSDIAHQAFTSQSITGGLTNTLTARDVNELRATYSANSVLKTYAIDTFGGAAPLEPSSLLVPPFDPTSALGELYVGTMYLYSGNNGGERQRVINAVDNFSHIVGAHQIKAGIDYLRTLPVFLGAFIDQYQFASVTTATSNTLSSFSASSQARVRSTSTNVSLFAQDVYKASAAITVTYGLRWELNPSPRALTRNNGNYVPLNGNYVSGAVSVGQAGSNLWNTQYTNIAPRIGLAYKLNRRAGTETILRVGGGLFYDVAAEGAVFLPFESGFPNSIARRLTSGSFPIPAAQAALPSISLAQPAASSSFYVYPANLAAPRSWQWNVATEQAIGTSQTITVSWVAALGRKLLYQQYYPSVGPSQYRVTYTDNSASSSYQSLQLQYQRRSRTGLAFVSSYTWSHSIDDSSSDISQLAPTPYLNVASNRGPSDFDVRHSLSAAVSYTLPTAARARWAKALGSGWGLDALISARTSLPVNVTYTENVGFGSLAFRPDVVSSTSLYISTPNAPGGRAINVAAFRMNPAGQGDLGRNALQGFGLFSADISARRSFRLREGVDLTFRADAFNAFNHPNFANPVSTLSLGTFGYSTSMANAVLGASNSGSFGLSSLFQTGGARSLQLSLRLRF